MHALCVLALPISRVCVLRAVCIACSTCVSARSAVSWQRARATITDHTYTDTVTAQLYTTRATTDRLDKAAPVRKKNAAKGRRSVDYITGPRSALLSVQVCVALPRP